MTTGRCTPRKHVREKGEAFCDCRALMVALTAERNAHVITIMDPVQRDALAQMGPRS